MTQKTKKPKACSAVLKINGRGEVCCSIKEKSSTDEATSEEGITMPDNRHMIKEEKKIVLFLAQNKIRGKKIIPISLR